MTGSPSKRDLQKEERRQQILEAALAVFAQKGFNAANVSDVAAQAGVSQGTIYWYFESKDELLMAALTSVIEAISISMLEGLAADATAADKLRMLGASVEQFGELDTRLFPMFLEFWSSSLHREEAAQVWLDLLKRYKEMLVGVIEEGIANGEFRDVDAEGLVWAVMAALDGLAAYAMLMPDLDMASISRVFVEALLTGLETDTATPQ
jgi:AcrR family transcriptional regulator